MGEESLPAVLDRALVAEQLGVRPNTITYYLSESQPGGRYEKKPFPAPDGRVGTRPFWYRRRLPAIRRWFTERERAGVGGRKRRS